MRWGNFKVVVDWASKGEDENNRPPPPPKQQQRIDNLIKKRCEQARRYYKYYINGDWNARENK